MQNGIILYKSKYGGTEKYARKLHEITGFELAETKKTKPEDVMQYKTIILCGGIYASGIAGLSFLKKNYDKLKDKNLTIFCVGASPYDENALEKIRAFNLKGKLKDIPLFYGRGTWDESIMTFRDRTLCRLLQKAVAKKDSASCEPWMKALMSASGQKCDWTDKKYLSPLLECLNDSIKTI